MTLKKSNSDQILNLNPLPSWIYDVKNSKILHVNDPAIALYGYPKNEFLKLYASDLNHLEEKKNIFDEIENLKSQNSKIYVGKYTHQKKSGERIYIEITAQKVRYESSDCLLVVGFVIRNNDGNPITFEKITQDNTEQKKEEQHLKLLESVVTNTNDAVLITEAAPFDGQGHKIIYVNEAFTKMTGYTSEEVIGKTPKILQGPKSDREELAKLGRALRKWEKCTVSSVNYKKNGEEFWTHFTVSPVANSQGLYTHWIAIQRDITEEKNIEFEKELLRKISSCFSQEKALFGASARLCEEIGEYGSFDLVELWTPNLEKSSIYLISKYATDEKFYSGKDNIKSFDEGVGMPGNVWKKNKQILWSNNKMSDFFIRKDCAKKAGINAVLGVPLQFKSEIVGVLIIGTKKEGTYLEKYRKTVERLEQFIGSEIQRKKLEIDLYQTYNTIPDILCVIDFDERFLRINDAGCKLLGYSQDEIQFQSINNFVHFEDQKTLKKHLENLKTETSNYQFETRFITKNKNIIWLIFNCN